MTFTYYTNAKNSKEKENIKSNKGDRTFQPGNPNPADYIPDPGLVDAVNVALMLGQPLLLTGEPGTGKTRLASHLSHDMDLGKPLKFETKSTSVSRELFYTYDALGRFQAKDSGASSKSIGYIYYNALGKAILLANSEEKVKHLLPVGFKHGGKKRSVVLIDEVDKAPRDFPNDILNEIEGMFFRVPELDNIAIEADSNDPDVKPVVIITSNSEKDLPDAFLRRCIFYDIPFPTKEQMEEIVTRHLGIFTGDNNKLLNEALELFFKLREGRAGLRKKPATAELLGWLIVLKENLKKGSGKSIRSNPEAVMSTISALAKTAEDQARAKKVIDQWLK
ncbi:MAG: MoxR family ATPase [Candidatus Brocadiaceae bacterium]|nr:MoxR family ATPase [Candidatus Brocadiaceae bacterium]